MTPTFRIVQILFAVLVVVFVSGASFIVGARYAGNYTEGQYGTTLLADQALSALQPIDTDFSPLWKAWNVIETSYVPPSTKAVVPDDKKLWGTIQGLADSLGDPYTVFLPPADNEVFEADISGNFEGVGMEIGMRKDRLTVIAPLKNSPAERAGIRAGDIIVKIDDLETDGITVDEAVQNIRGEGGTAVRLTLAREGESEFVEISVVREVIAIPTINTELRDDGIFIIELYNFSATAPGLFQQALREFALSGSHDLIFDLRGNPGGYLEAAVDIASYFLSAGEVIVREDFGDKREEIVHRSKGYNVFSDNSLDMVILINQGSASASEIVAGALAEHGVATLVGETSFGKGSVQELVEITPETSLKVTIARWLTPNGTSISDGGLKPDVEVKITPEDIEEGNDPQRHKAAEILLSR